MIARKRKQMLKSALRWTCWMICNCYRLMKIGNTVGTLDGTMTTTMLCDVDCITSDNDFERSDFEVAKSYTLEQLKAFFE